MKQFLITMSIIAIIVLGIYCPIVWLIIGIGLIIVIALIFFLIKSYDKNDDAFMKNKFGENYKDLIKDGSWVLERHIHVNQTLIIHQKKR